MTVVIKGLEKWEVIGLKASYRENVIVLPAERGRLIDADALFEKVYEFYGEDCETAENWMMGKINDAPTIIPADKEGKT